MTWFFVAIGVVSLVLFFKFLKNKQQEVEESFQTRFADKNIQFMDKNALYIARESDGNSHFRGVGYLVLTEDELYFERQIDRMVIVIPLRSILKVDTTKKLAGQSPGAVMLKVAFNTPEGKEDAVAWKLKELQEWVVNITNMLTNASNKKD